MSVVGTGAAAGVAQAANQAQQVARTQNRQEQDDAEAAERLRDKFEHHLHAVEEGQEETPAELRVGDQPHDQQRPEHDKAEPEDAPADEQPTDPAAPPPTPGDDPLYHHVDLTA